MNTTIVQWLRNGLLISTFEHCEAEIGDELMSALTIINVTKKDEGNYTCFGFYNSSIVTTKKIITSNSKSLLLSVVEGMF